MAALICTRGGRYAAGRTSPRYGPEGRALHAATSPFTGIRQFAPKAKELTVERHYTGESGSRILPVKSPAACQ
nr:MAG TPA: hypothetical protein [Caudoviricetes sp.]DAM32024.1 MAG TPA: hypothetical protein [Caudoviricetes sp.]